MANKKISDLTDISTASASDDEIPIVDTSATATKKLTMANLVTYILSALTDMLPTADNTYDLGSAAKKWKELFVTTLNLAGTAITATAAEINAVCDGQTLADKTAMEAATANAVVIADLLHNHPAVLKAWVYFNGTNGTVTSHYNITGNVTRASAGRYTITFGTNFSNTNYCVLIEAIKTGGGSNHHGLRSEATWWTKAVGTLKFEISDGDGDLVDCEEVYMAFLGDQ